MTRHLPDATLVEASLIKHGTKDVAIHVFERLESTSQWLKDQPLGSDAAASQPQPYTQADVRQQRPGQAQLCITDSQIAGIGRRGKSWQTLPGNITFSLSSVSDSLPQELMGLSLVTGLAVCTVLRDEFSLDVALKWPNDVICSNAKLGGLLTEIMTMKNTGALSNAGAVSEPPVSQIITGVGINVLHDPSVSGLGIGATSMQEAGISLARHDRDKLVGTVAARILLLHEQFHAEGWAPFSAVWKQYDWLADREISIHRASSTESGVARGVSEQGALLVESQGEIKPLFGGDVSIRPTV